MKFENIFPSPIKKTINGDEVEIKQYLPLKDKNAILEMVIQTADGGTVVNELALEAIFEVYLVLKYTDIQFTDEERNDLFALYDNLECAGIIKEVISTIPATEYKLLHDSLVSIVNEYKTYRNSAKGFLDTFLAFAPDAAEKINETIASLDSEKIDNITNIAKQVGLKQNG